MARFRGATSVYVLASAAVVALLCTLSVTAIAQSKPELAGKQIPVVMLSDLHFDPMHDPDKVSRLDKAPLSEWKAILDAPATATQAARFAAVQEACSGKEGADSSYALLRSSLSAARTNAESAAFVTVSGDLLVHDLDCRYRVSMHMPASTGDDQSASAAFAEKTTVFVMTQVEMAFPRIPVYLALGNNDSRCNHNRLDLQDEYLKVSAATVIRGLHGVSEAEKQEALQTYQFAGYYAVTMPAPMTNTRLIVVDDIYMMPKYANCEANASDHKGEKEQSLWLQEELRKASETHQRVWLLGHLPPVVNADSSLSAKGEFCSTKKVVRYQTSEDLADQMTANASVIKLGIFGHTHMDEFYLLRERDVGIPVKVVASVSPVSGNLPSFTVGYVDVRAAELSDYSVFKALNATGEHIQWTKEYSFNQTYGEKGFSQTALLDVVTRLQSDKQGTSSDSVSYRQHFLKGAGGKKLSSSWQGYTCSMDNPTSAGFTHCVCPVE